MTFSALIFRRASLSHRETEVCQLLLNRLTLGDIANELNISVHTVDIHRANIYRKLHVHSRVELLQHFASVPESLAV